MLRCDDPCGNTINAGIEEIQADMHLVQFAAADQFFPIAAVVNENHHVVAVPANRPLTCSSSSGQNIRNG